ncbi:MAG: hypothetical protein Q4C43_07735 [Prevotella sp.]|nr:hypothetical protein [Prevotella sp.]
MRKLLLALCAVMTAGAAGAAETGDTTVVYQGKTFVLGTDNSETKVAVYDADGVEMKKTHESSYVDGQEIEQVYITSPFLPQKKRSRRYRDHIPDLYYGYSPLAGSVGGFDGGSRLHAKTVNSYEWGITTFGLGIPFNRAHTFGVTTAFSAGYVRHNFDPGYAMFNVDGRTEILPLDGDEGAKKSYLSYWYMRIPVIFEWQKHINGNEAYVGLGVSMEYRAKEHSRFKGGKSGTITPTGDLNMNPVGLNLEAHVGYGGIVLGLSTALTPLLNTSSAPRCYPVSMTLGVKLW